MAITSLLGNRELSAKRLSVTNQNFINQNTYYTVHSVNGTGQIKWINVNWNTGGGNNTCIYRLTVDGVVISTGTLSGVTANSNLVLDGFSTTQIPLNISFKSSFLFEGQSSIYYNVAIHNSICLYELKQ